MKWPNNVPRVKTRIFQLQQYRKCDKKVSGAVVKTHNWAAAPRI